MPNYSPVLMLKRVAFGALAGLATALTASEPPNRYLPYIISGVLSAFGVDLHSYKLSQKGE